MARASNAEFRRAIDSVTKCLDSATTLDGAKRALTDGQGTINTINKYVYNWAETGSAAATTRPINSHRPSSDQYL